MDEVIFGIKNRLKHNQDRSPWFDDECVKVSAAKILARKQLKTHPTPAALANFKLKRTQEKRVHRNKKRELENRMLAELKKEQEDPQTIIKMRQELYGTSETPDPVDPVSGAKKSDEEGPCARSGDITVKKTVPPVSSSAETSKESKASEKKPRKKSTTKYATPDSNWGKLCGKARQRLRYLMSLGMDYKTARAKCMDPITGSRDINDDSGNRPRETSSTSRTRSREVLDDSMGRGSSFTSSRRQSRSRSREALDLRESSYDDDSGQSLDELSPLQIEEKLRRLDEKELRLDLERDTLLQSFSTNSKQRRLLDFDRIERRKTRALRRLEKRNQEEDQSQQQQRRNDVYPNRFIEDIPFRRDLSPPSERQNMSFQSDRSFDHEHRDSRDMNNQNDRFGLRNMNQERPSDFFGGSYNNNFGPRDPSSISDMRNNFSLYGQGPNRQGSYPNMSQDRRLDNNFGQSPPNQELNQFCGNEMMQQRHMDGPWGGNLMGMGPNSPPNQQGNPNANQNNGGFWRPYGNNNRGPFGGGPGMQPFSNNNQQQQMMNNMFQNPMMGGGPDQGQGMMGVFQNNNNMQRGGPGGMQGMMNGRQGYQSHPGRRHYN